MNQENKKLTKAERKARFANRVDAHFSSICTMFTRHLTGEEFVYMMMNESGIHQYVNVMRNAVNSDDLPAFDKAMTQFIEAVDKGNPAGDADGFLKVHYMIKSTIADIEKRREEAKIAGSK